MVNKHTFSIDVIDVGSGITPTELLKPKNVGNVITRSPLKILQSFLKSVPLKELYLLLKN